MSYLLQTGGINSMTRFPGHPLSQDIILNENQGRSHRMSRRKFIRKVALSVSALTANPILGWGDPSQKTTGPARRTLSLNTDWLFGGKYQAAALQPKFDDTAFARISLPHCVSKLSWQGWQYSDWADVWIYRRHFSLPREHANQRVYLDFDGGMGGTTPVINGHALPEYVGGYLPFHYEITNWLAEKDNVLAVAVDSRLQNTPPEIPARGPAAIDFFQPGGLPRSVALRVVPQVFISDVFAKPVDVLKAGRRVEVTCSIDAAILPSKPMRLKVELFDLGKRIAHVSQTLKIEQPGETELKLTLSDLGNVKLWEVDAPQLYQLVTTLILDETPVHDYQVRIGFREARFELDGFFSQWPAPADLWLVPA